MADLDKLQRFVEVALLDAEDGAGADMSGLADEWGLYPEHTGVNDWEIEARCARYALGLPPFVPSREYH